MKLVPIVKIYLSFQTTDADVLADLAKLDQMFAALTDAPMETA